MKLSFVTVYKPTAAFPIDSLTDHEMMFGLVVQEGINDDASALFLDERRHKSAILRRYLV
jgi:hypothetical protein